ncbi:condensation domain-containing protein [Actinokineospora cianjurensis]|uniref:Condensation domain-containing protein n=1 Tax=Actinokineospora cianjurensis TaxID=585224 RepID=A0A421B382_9PSEU|nr:condensation domain-containing protein [Actinokineospora cianjurensis]RLK58743.1 condensation domain-containing protein [Actinokineospora cianjurensis]
MITESRAVVEFHGGTARTGPLCWGQQGTWDSLAQWYPEVKPFFFLTRWLPVPLLLEVGDVLAVVGELLVRHESLRTHVSQPPGGEPTQRVLASGTLPVDVHDRPADDPVQFEDIVATCWERGTARPLDHSRELPLRLSIALHEGIPVVIAFTLSHLAADYTATDALVRELTAMLDAKASGTPLPPARPAAQPLDLAQAERSPEGQRRNVDAIRHLRSVLDRAPAPIPPQATPESPRFVGADLESDLLAVAVRRTARRCRTSTSVVLLALTTALVRSFWPEPRLRLDIMQGNRTSPEVAASVTTLNQVVHTITDLDGESLTELLDTATRAMAVARAHSRYDNRAAREVLRAGDLPPGVQFNDMWSTLPAGPRTATPSATTLTWPATSNAESMALYLDVRGTPTRIRLGAMADTAILPRADLAALLHTFEHLAVDWAEGVDGR